MHPIDAPDLSDSEIQGSSLREAITMGMKVGLVVWIVWFYGVG